MAKRNRIPGNIPQAAAQMVDLVSDAGWEVGMRGQPAFAKFVDYAVARAGACGGGSRAQDAALGTSFNQTIPAAPFNTAFDILSTWAERSFEDVLGPAYMLVLGRDRSGMGQFFTPFSICQVMARLAMGNLPELDPANMPLMVHDPCVGSGGLLLAQAELYPQAWHERGYVLFSGVDLDPLARRWRTSICACTDCVQRSRSATRSPTRLIGRTPSPLHLTLGRLSAQVNC